MTNKIFNQIKSLIPKFRNRNNLQNLPKIGQNSIIEESNISTNVVIGKQCYIHKSTIKDFTYISRNASVMNTTMGKFCSIARNVSIGTGDHPTNYISTSPIFYSPNNPFNIKLVNEYYFKELSPVNIGNDVWIGVNAVIKNGITIGNGAIIGANAIITKDVPPFAIMVGIPGKVLKYRFSAQKIKEIEELEWWNWDLTKLKQKINDFNKNIE